MRVKYRFEIPIQLWKSNPSWHFGLLPQGISSEIADLSSDFRRGFGAVRVQVGIGGTSWATSVFPDATLNCYVLPLKASVRKAEGLTTKSVPLVEIELLDY